MAAGRSNAAIAATLYLSLSAVEKNITAIFGKPGLAEEGSSHRRVAAVLAFLGEHWRPLGCSRAARGAHDAMIGLERP